jgi:hypothetical protein
MPPAKAGRDANSSSSVSSSSSEAGLPRPAAAQSPRSELMERDDCFEGGESPQQQQPPPASSMGARFIGTVGRGFRSLAARVGTPLRGGESSSRGSSAAMVQAPIASVAAGCSARAEQPAEADAMDVDDSAAPTTGAAATAAAAAAAAAVGGGSSAADSGDQADSDAPPAAAAKGKGKGKSNRTAAAAAAESDENDEAGADSDDEQQQSQHQQEAESAAAAAAAEMEVDSASPNAAAADASAGGSSGATPSTVRKPRGRGPSLATLERHRTHQESILEDSRRAQQVLQQKEADDEAKAAAED